VVLVVVVVVEVLVVVVGRAVVGGAVVGRWVVEVVTTVVDVELVVDVGGVSSRPLTMA